MSTLKNKIIICVGSGGVGKTTVASVLGLYHALLGQKTLVITVDPAKRLLDVLGVSESHSIPQLVDVTALTNMMPKEGGSLFAFMPDLKREWHDFLESAIDKADVRNEIASNHFYRYMADGLPGAFEIICSHVFFRITKQNDFDVIILDTPPSSHSLAFFDVPKKVSAVLEQSLFRHLVRKQNSLFLKLTKKLAFLSGGFLQLTLERLIGSHFLSELIDFALTIDGLYDPMLKRAKAMEHLFVDENTHYVHVLKPTAASVNDWMTVNKALVNRGINVSHVVMNQVLKNVDSDELSHEMGEICQKSGALKTAVQLYQQQLSSEKALIERVLKNRQTKNFIILSTSNKKDRAQLLTELLHELSQGWT